MMDSLRVCKHIDQRHGVVRSTRGGDGVVLKTTTHATALAHPRRLQGLTAVETRDCWLVVRVAANGAMR